MNESVKNDLFDVVLSEAFRRYEEEYLNSLPSEDEANERYPLPEGELRSVERYRKRLEKEKKYGRPLAVVRLRRAAVIVLAALSLAFGAMMLNGEVRAAVGKAIVQVFERFTEIEFRGGREGADERRSIYDYDVLSNIPEGYKLIEEKENTHERYYVFADFADVKLRVKIIYSEGYGIGLDNEYSFLEEIEIDGNKAYKNVNTSTDPFYISIIVPENNIVLSISGFESDETMVGIAEAIIKK